MPNGRFGPYVKCGKETRSLPAGISPLDVTLPQALELLAQPKALRRGFGVKRSRSKCWRFDGDKQKIQLLEGRYGLYLADGETNASLPKGVTPEELTFEQAEELLAAAAWVRRKRKRAGAIPNRSAKTAAAPAAAKKKSEAKAVKKPAAKKKATGKQGSGKPGSGKKAGKANCGPLDTAAPF